MKLRKLVAFAAVLAMVGVLFAGCGNSGGGSGDSGDGDATFKIGGIGPVTGPAAAYGVAVKNGMEMAVEEINADGGIDGTKIEIQFEDDEHDAEKALNAYNTLKDWGMQMLLGTVTSTPCAAVAAETANDQIFQLTPSGSAKECTANDNAFRVCFADPDQGKVSADYIADHDLAKKVAVIYDSSDNYSNGIYETFKAEADSKGLEIVAAEAFTADNNKDFSTQIQKAKDGGAELVFLPIYYTEASLILDQAKKADFTATFFGCDGLDGLLGLENFDTSLAEGVMLLTPFVADADDEATQKFTKAYEEKYGETPLQFAADAYDGIYAIKAACEEEKVSADMDIAEICKKMMSGMTKITVNGLTGDEEGISWTADGEPNKAPKACVIKDGKYEMME